MTNKIFMVSLVLAFGCGKDKPEAKPVTPPPAVAPQEPQAVVSIDAGLKEHMHDHFSAIRKIERAIVQGDTKAAEEQATWLASHDPSAEISTHQEQLDSLRTAAQAVASSTSLEQSAKAAAALASECGACHLATTSIASFEWTELPAAGDKVVDRMLRHQWAMDRLWEGLVGPSEMSWSDGAAVLAAEPMEFPAEFSEAKRSAGTALLAKVQSLAKRAQTADGLSARAEIYGDLLNTCSGCHKLRE